MIYIVLFFIALLCFSSPIRVPFSIHQVLYIPGLHILDCALVMIAMGGGTTHICDLARHPTHKSEHKRKFYTIQPRVTFDTKLFGEESRSTHELQIKVST